MRPGELIALHWEDVNGAKVRIHRGVSSVKNRPVPSSVKTAKGNRVITLPTDMRVILTEHRSYLEPEQGKTLVFPSRNGTFLEHRNIRRSITQLAELAKVPVIRTHDLRHTYASMRIAAGADPLRLSRELGHANPSFTLNRYGHIFERYRVHEAPSLAELLGYDAEKLDEAA